jgi:hypothetical protein
VVTTGAGLEAELVDGSPLGIQALVTCKDWDFTYLGTCGDRACDPQAICHTGTPIEKRLHVFNAQLPTDALL